LVYKRRIYSGRTVTRVYVGVNYTSELSTGWYYNDDTGEPVYYTYGSGVSSIDSC